jgi:TetR/AcrR family transcriptional repressor of nem operon
MARPKEFDPDVALAAAMETFWESGYDATSLADITRATGVQKASLYATYGDKRRLFITALSRYQEDGLARLRAGLATGATVRESFEAIFAGAVKECASKDRARGCLCVNTAVELGPRDPEIAAMLLMQARRMTALFAEALERGKARGELDASLDTQVIARFLLFTLYGIHVGGKTGFGAKKLDDVAATALAILRR